MPGRNYLDNKRGKMLYTRLPVRTSISGNARFRLQHSQGQDKFKRNPPLSFFFKNLIITTAEDGTVRQLILLKLPTSSSLLQSFIL